MKIVRLINIEPALVITPDEVLRIDGDGAKPVPPSHLIPWQRDAHWLHLALDPTYDPLKYAEFIEH